MRLVGSFIFLSIAVTMSWAQMEPCLAGTDRPDCGIRIVVNPAPDSPVGNVISVPSEVTIDVPLRLHSTKIQIKAGPAGTDVASFKPLAMNAHYKKVGKDARFLMEIKSCPDGDSLLVFNILSPRLPYPIAANSTLFECKQQGTK
jgi:hypothetical protein